MIRTAITRDSHWYFFHFYFAHYVKYATAAFQKEMIALTEDENVRNIFIVACRGSGKSTIITTSFPLWAILGKQKKKFVLILTQTKAQAKQHMMNLRYELEKQDLLKSDLGPFQEQQDEWGSGSLVFSNLNARITVASSEQAIRGIRHGEHRPDLIILDDVEDMASAKTHEGRMKTFNWFTGEVLPAGDKNTRVVVVGNLLHEDSLLVRLGKGVRNGDLSGVFRSYPLLDDKGAILWPGKYPTMADVEVDRKKIGNEVSWQREYLLKIVPDEDQIIFPEWIHYYDEAALGKLKPHKTIIAVDLAIAQKETSDYTAIVSAYLCGRGKDMKVYILPNPVNEHMTFPETVERIKQLYLVHHGNGNYPLILIEDVGYQRSIIDQLHSEGFPAEGFKVNSDKRSRLTSISNLVQNGTILFPHKGSEKLLRQLIGFGAEKHDDLVDSFTMIGHRTVTEKNRPVPWIKVISTESYSQSEDDRLDALMGIKNAHWRPF